MTQSNMNMNIDSHIDWKIHRTEKENIFCHNYHCKNIWKYHYYHLRPTWSSRLIYKKMNLMTIYITIIFPFLILLFTAFVYKENTTLPKFQYKHKYQN